MNYRFPTLGLALLITLFAACDDPSDAATETSGSTATTETAAQPETPATGAGAADSTPAPRQVDPERYMMFVDRGLMKLQRNITICTLPWKQEFPDRELKVVLVFELAPSGKPTRAEARVPSEASRIGSCIEQVVIRAQFSPGAPPKPFVKTMVFNPQDLETEKMKVKGLPANSAAPTKP